MGRLSEYEAWDDTKQAEVEIGVKEVKIEIDTLDLLPDQPRWKMTYHTGEVKRSMYRYDLIRDTNSTRLTPRAAEYWRADERPTGIKELDR